MSESLKIVRPSRADAPAVAQIIIDCDVAESGAVDFSLEELEQEWQRPDFDLQTDTWLAYTAEDKLAGYAEVLNLKGVNIQASAYVPPGDYSRAVAEKLLDLMDERVRQHLVLHQPLKDVTLNSWINAANTTVIPLLETRQFQPVRSIWRMKIELKETPPLPVFPAGLELKNTRMGVDDRAVYEAYEDAFADHWGHERREYSEWLKTHSLREPSLCFLAMDGDQIAGFALCSDFAQMPMVDLLGVRSAWRGSGLGLALLNQVFGDFYRLGRREVRLGVDSQNESGATRLYKRAGMYVERQYVCYQKDPLSLIKTPEGAQGD